MEYDRALYRVYERIMEDLNSSHSPLALTSNNATTTVISPSHHNGGLRRRYNRVNNQDEGDANDNDETADDDLEESNINNNEASSDSQQSRRGRRQTRAAQQQHMHIIARRTQQQQRREALPFILPIWLSRKIDVLDHGNNNSGFVSQLWSNMSSRGILSLRGREEGSYDSVATSPSSHSSHLRPSTPTTRESDHRDDETIDLESGGLEMQTLSLSPSNSIERSDSYNEGLRRRSPTRRPSPSNNNNNDSSMFHNERRSTTTTLPSIPTTHASSSILQPRISSPPTSNNNEGAAVTSLAQRAIQNQLRQNEQQQRRTRRRRRNNRRPRADSTSSGDSESASSSSNSNNSVSSSTSSSSSDESDQNQNNNTANSNEGCSQTNLYIVMRLSFWMAILHVFILICLHGTYVGPYAFHKQTRLLNNNVDLSHKGRSFRQWFRRRSLAWGNVGVRDDNNSKDATKNTQLINCISYALNTRPIEDRSTYFGQEKDEHSSNDDDSKRRDRFLTSNNGGLEPIKSEEEDSDATNEENSPLLGMDEILQIKILYGGKKCTGKCSRVRKVVYPQVKEESDVNDDGDDDDANLDQIYKYTYAKKSRDNTKSVVEDMDSNGYDRQLKWGKHKTDNDNSNATAEDELSSPTYWEKPHYRYAIDDAVLYLDEQAALLHNITVVNVTVTERCLSTGKDDGRLTFTSAIAQFLSQIYGMDSVIINQLMYGIRGINGDFTKSGYVKNMETQERWGWHRELMDSFEYTSLGDWLLKKIGVLLLSTLAFFLITSVTSLIVRVLTSSGVVLMFPLFTLFRQMGMPGADERILSLSYPWIGTARAAIRNENVHPQSHLVWAHVTKIVLYYVMYEACQAAWSVVLYAKSIPEALPVWIYGFTMIWEYFNMVFIRSALAVHFFPRVTFFYFFVYHCYFYSVPYGWFDIALIPLFLFMVHSMLYTILALEAPNAKRGFINVEKPREVYNRLSWQEPIAALPAEWTIFMPLNSRTTSLHDREVVAQNNVNEVNEEGNGDIDT